MNTENYLPETERAALQAGLAEAKRRGPQLIATPDAAHVRTQLYLAPDEHAGLKLMKHTLGFHIGRPVAQTLIVRLALRRLMQDVSKSHKDPVAAARLKAELLAVRAERVALTS